MRSITVVLAIYDRTRDGGIWQLLVVVLELHLLLGMNIEMDS